MVEIADVVVRDKALVLTNLPFSDGEIVRVTISPSSDTPGRLTIADVRQLLRGHVERFDDPFEPMIPPHEWEMIK